MSAHAARRVTLCALSFGRPSPLADLCSLRRSALLVRGVTAGTRTRERILSCALLHDRAGVRVDLRALCGLRRRGGLFCELIAKASAFDGVAEPSGDRIVEVASLALLENLLAEGVLCLGSPASAELAVAKRDGERVLVERGWRLDRVQSLAQHASCALHAQ